MMERKDRLPIDKTPLDFFAQLAAPGLVAVIFSSILLKAHQFGKTTSGELNEQTAMIGIGLFLAVVTLCFLLLRRRGLGVYTRLMILYLAFVPHLSINYMKRFSDFEYLFETRINFFYKLYPTIAYWLQNLMSLFTILVPILILMLAARAVKKLPRWYLVLIGLGVALAFLIFHFMNLTNAAKYLISLFAVCIIDDCWEKIREENSLEPAVMVFWAEFALFAALWLKGIVEMTG